MKINASEAQSTYLALGYFRSCPVSVTAHYQMVAWRGECPERKKMPPDKREKGRGRGKKNRLFVLHSQTPSLGNKSREETRRRTSADLFLEVRRLCWDWFLLHNWPDSQTPASISWCRFWMSIGLVWSVSSSAQAIIGKLGPNWHLCFSKSWQVKSFPLFMRVERFLHIDWKSETNIF